MTSKMVSDIENMIKDLDLYNKNESEIKEEIKEDVIKKYNIEDIDEKVLYSLIKKSIGRLRSKGKYGTTSSSENKQSNFIVDSRDMSGVCLYGDNWIEKAEYIREQYDRKCVSCERREKQKKLSVHHIIPRKKFLEDFTKQQIRRLKEGTATEKLEEEFKERIKIANKNHNLVPLCSSCHGSVENLSLEKQISKFDYNGENLTILNPTKVL
jgi:hypothetical protein